MYRVELKAIFSFNTSISFSKFLMYRVELKGICYPYDSPQEGVEKVPNVPCGVESEACEIIPRILPYNSS